MNWDYIAGFFDGEGNIKKQSSIVSMSQKRSEVLSVIQDFLQLNGISVTKYTHPSQHGASSLSIHRLEDCLEFLRAIRDKIIVKKTETDNAILVMEGKLQAGRHRHYKTRQLLYHKIKALREAGYTYLETQAILHCGCSTISKVMKVK